MADSCFLYYITDRSAFPGDESSRQRRLLEKIREAARASVDYIQLRERDLSVRDLESLARESVRVIREETQATALLMNSRTDVALAVQANGVHLRSDDISPQEVRTIWQWDAGALARETSLQDPVIGVSCHSPAEVTQAAKNGATFAVFAPVFGKQNMPPAGLAALAEVCEASIPVLALGGITLANAHSCLEAGASGIAAIRLFQENDIADIARRLRHS